MSVRAGGAPRRACMRRELRALAALCCIAAVCSGGQAEIASGRAVGEMTPSFPVLAVSGPQPGKLVCHVCESDGAPVVFAFFRRTGDETAGVMRKLDELARAQNVRVVAVMTDVVASRPWLEKIAADTDLTIALAVLPNGEQDVAFRLYKLDARATNTVLVSVNRAVTANFVNVSARNFGLLAAAVTRLAGDQRRSGAK